MQTHLDADLYARASMLRVETPTGFCALDPAYPAEKAILDRRAAEDDPYRVEVLFADCANLARSRETNTKPIWGIVAADALTADQAASLSRTEYLASIRNEQRRPTSPIQNALEGDEGLMNVMCVPVASLIELEQANSDIATLCPGADEDENGIRHVMVMGITAVKGIPFVIVIGDEGKDLPVRATFEALAPIVMNVARDLLKRNGEL